MGGGSDETFLYPLVRLWPKIYDILSNDLHALIIFCEGDKWAGGEWGRRQRKRRGGGRWGGGGGGA